MQIIKRFFYKGVYFTYFDFYNSENSDSFIKTLPKLWYFISGKNKYPLIYLAAIFYKWPLKTPFLELILNKDTIKFMPNFQDKNLLLTIHIKFIIFYENSTKIDKVYIRYNVPELLLINSKLTKIKYKGFKKFILKKFYQNDVKLDNIYLTKIRVKYIFREGKDRKF